MHFLSSVGIPLALTLWLGRLQTAISPKHGRGAYRDCRGDLPGSNLSLVSCILMVVRSVQAVTAWVAMDTIKDDEMGIYRQESRRQ
jgi:hypothetical protein